MMCNIIDLEKNTSTKHVFLDDKTAQSYNKLVERYQNVMNVKMTSQEIKFMKMQYCQLEHKQKDKWFQMYFQLYDMQLLDDNCLFCFLDALDNEKRYSDLIFLYTNDPKKVTDIYNNDHRIFEKNLKSDWDGTIYPHRSPGVSYGTSSPAENLCSYGTNSRRFLTTEDFLNK